MRRLIRLLKCALGFHRVYGLYADRFALARDGRGQYERQMTCIFCRRTFP